MQGNEHYERAEHLLKPGIWHTPGTYINAGPADGEEILPSEHNIEMGKAQALMAIAFELRTQNIIALQSTPGWLDDARARVGHPTAPPQGFTAAHQVPVIKPDPRCEKHLMDGRNEIRCWLPVNHFGECR